MKKILGLLLVIFLLPSLGETSSVEKDIMGCSLLKSDKERLECYDKIAASLSLESSDPIDEKGKWIVNKSNSPIDDSPIVTIALPADSSSSNRGSVWWTPLSRPFFSLG